MKHQSTPLLLVLLGLLAACLAPAAEPVRRIATKPVTVFANFGSVNTNTTVDSAGNRVYLLTFQTTQYGTEFFGVFHLACEVTGQNGAKYFGTATANQHRGYGRRTICEWEFELKTEDIKAPSLTGYYAYYSAPDIAKPLDKRAFGCGSEDALTTRNADSKPLSVRSKLVRLVGGEN